MKKLLLLAATAAGLLAARPVAAQYYLTPFISAGQNPGGLNNDLEERGQTGWNIILTGNAVTATTPAWTPAQTVPFPFQFNGSVAPGYIVSSSGVLTFSTGTALPAPSGTNAALPSAALPDQSVCVWGTVCTVNNDFISTKTFGTAPNRQHWIQFTSVGEAGNTANAPFLYWAIVLEETTNKIYVVEQWSGLQNATPNLSLTVGVQVNSTTAVQTALSPNQTATTYNTQDDTPADNSYWTFAPGNRPAGDLALTALTLPSIASRQNPVPVTGQFRNLGAQAVTSYILGYQVNNGAAVTGTVTGSSLASLATGNFVHPTPWQPASGGVYRLKVWTSSPNGLPDADHSNDTLRTSVVVGDSTMRRLVVEECFTSATCPPCRPGNTIVENVNRTNPNKQVVIKYQQNFPGAGDDPYYTVESGARRGYYGINAIPYMTLDAGWNNNSQSFTAGILNQYQARPALARITGGYTLTGTTVTANAQIRPFLNFPAGRLVAHTVITERRTTRNARTNGETVFFHVMKKMLPNQNGTPLPALTSGQNFALTQSFDVSTLPATQAVEHFDSLQVVVFVQDVVTKDIYQGASLVLPRPAGTRTAQLGTAFSLVPNPGSGATAVHFALAQPETVRVEVLDLLGRLVLDRPQVRLGSGSQEVPLVLPGQAPGLYTVRLTTSAGTRTGKLTLE